MDMHLTFTIDQPADLVFKYLTDMQKFASVHPVITKIVPAGNQQYVVHETLRIAFLPVSFTYSVTVESDRAKNWVKMLARVMKLVTIRMNFTIRTENSRTVVEEIIDFNAPVPLQFVMQPIFRKQHELLFKNIDGLSECE
ncbi:hypothetical protein GCM10028808_62750 [Spirosoma migulaei]